MFKKTGSVMLFLCFALIFYFIYDYFKIPAGIEVKNDSQEIIAWVALATSVVSLLTSIIGLIQKIIERPSE